MILSLGLSSLNVKHEVSVSWETFFEDKVHHNLFIKSLVYKSTLQLLRRIMKPGEKVLELGCGSGRVSIMLNDMGYETTSLDYAFPLVQQLLGVQRFFGGPSLVNGDMTALPFQDKAFKVACSFEVMEHFKPDRIIHFLKEQKRVAEYVVVDVPNESYRIKSFGDENFYSDDTWIGFFESAGLRVHEFFHRGMDNGLFVGNCTVFFAVDSRSDTEPVLKGDVYDHY